MITDQIRQQIQEAIRHEKQTGALADHLRNTLSTSKRTVPEKAIQQGISLVREYIEQVPVLLEESVATALQLGELENVAPLFEGAVGYFLNPRDYIPDNLGLYGLLDDAYLALRLLEVLNNIYRHHPRATLIPIDLSGPNRKVRGFIGDELANRLDQEIVGAVQQRIYQLSLQNLANQAYNAGGTGGGGGQSWGNTFEDQSAQFFAENGVSYNVDTQYLDQDGVQLY